MGDRVYRCAACRFPPAEPSCELCRDIAKVCGRRVGAVFCRAIDHRQLEIHFLDTDQLQWHRLVVSLENDYGNFNAFLKWPAWEDAGIELLELNIPDPGHLRQAKD